MMDCDGNELAQQMDSLHLYPVADAETEHHGHENTDAMSSAGASQGSGMSIDPDSARGCSPAPSVYSWHSSLDGHSLREAYGRLFNGNNETYMLPADEPEHGRLGLQHNAMLISLGGLYQQPAVVEHLLRQRDDGYVPACIDVGCGSGTWAIAMAKRFPHCQIVGVDLAVPKPNETIPPNCRFECDDANLGFAHFRGRFDVVHARSITSGIVDYPYFLRECCRMLRPGGIYLHVDGELQLYDEHFQCFPMCQPGMPRYSWLQRIFFACFASMANRGADVNGSPLVHYWMSEIPEFENVQHQDVFIPVGSWLNCDAMNNVMSELIRKDARLVIHGMKPMLMAEGFHGTTVEEWIAYADEELRTLSPRMYSVWHYAWARRPSTAVDVEHVPPEAPPVVVRQPIPPPPTGPLPIDLPPSLPHTPPTLRRPTFTPFPIYLLPGYAAERADGPSDAQLAAARAEQVEPELEREYPGQRELEAMYAANFAQSAPFPPLVDAVADQPRPEHQPSAAPYAPYAHAARYYAHAHQPYDAAALESQQPYIPQAQFHLEAQAQCHPDAQAQLHPDAWAQVNMSHDYVPQAADEAFHRDWAQQAGPSNYSF